MAAIPHRHQPPPANSEARLAYLLQALKPARPMRIADVGANPIDIPDYALLQRMGGCEVWGFEPDPAAFAQLERDKAPGAHYVQRAIGRTGPATFYPHKQSGFGSLLKMDEKAVGVLGKHRWYRQQQEGLPIDLVSLDDLPDAELPKPDLLKIDIQGGELDVFRTGREKLSDAMVIIPEVRFFPIYEGDPMFGDLDVELRAQGFDLHKLLFAKSFQVGNSLQASLKGQENRNQLLDGDAVYVRSLRAASDWSDDQFKWLALAAAGLFDSLDLALFCLDQLVARKVLDPAVPQEFLENLTTTASVEA